MKRVESGNPKRRAMMEEFLGPLTQADIDQVLSQTMLQKPYQESYDEFMQSAITEVLIPQDTNYASYSVSALARELLQLGNPSIWQLLFAQSPDKYQELKKHLKIDLQRFPDNSAGLRIAVLNLSFFGHAMINYAAAVSYGEEYDAYIQPQVKISPNNKLESHRHAAGLLAASHFGTPARNPQEVLSRLQTLFPADPPTPADIPALQFAYQTDAFREEFPNRIGTCIGVGTAQMLFSAYGRLLTTPDYQAILLQNIARPRAHK